MKNIKTNRNKSITITEGDVDSDSGDYIVYVPERKNKNLFGLRHDPDGFLALYYLKKVTPNLAGKSVIHHVRVLGEQTQSITSASTSTTSKHQASNKKELNMKVKLVVGK